MRKGVTFLYLSLIVITTLSLPLSFEDNTQIENDPFEMYTSLVEEKMLKFNVSHKPPQQPPIARFVEFFQKNLLSEQESDDQMTISLQKQLLLHSNSLSEASTLISQKLVKTLQKLDELNQRNQPTQELISAQHEKEQVINLIHDLHTKSQTVAEEVNHNLKLSQRNLQDLKKIQSSFAKGARPESVGRLRNYFGFPSNTANIVDRTLLHLIEMDNYLSKSSENNIQNNNNNNVQFLEIVQNQPSWFSELFSAVSAEAIDFATSIKQESAVISASVDRFYNALPSTKLYEFKFSSPFAGNTPQTQTNNNNNNVNVNTLQVNQYQSNENNININNPNTNKLEPMTMVQLGNPEISLETKKDEVNVTESNVPTNRTLLKVIFVNVSVQEFYESSLRSIIKVLFSEVPESSRNITQIQNLTVEEMKILLSNISSVSISNTTIIGSVVLSAFEDTINSDDASVLSIETPESSLIVNIDCTTGFATNVIEYFKVNSLKVLFSEHFNLSSNVNISLQTSELKSNSQIRNSLTNLMSFDEQKLPVSDIGCCGVEKVGEIMKKIIHVAEFSDSKLKAKREELVQPLASQLIESQKRLSTIEKNIKFLQLKQPNVEGDIETFKEIANVLQTTKDFCTKTSQEKMSYSDKHISAFNSRQDVRDNEMKAADDLTEILNIQISESLMQRRESTSQNRLFKAEENANRAFVQSQLKDKRQKCIDSLAKIDELIEEQRRKIDIFEKMIDLLSGFSTVSDISNLINVASSLTLEQKVDPIMLVETSTSIDDMKTQFFTIVRSRIESTKVVLQEQIDARAVEQSQCDQQINRIESQLTALLN
eukprot:c20542_g1_i1.p1 GENE.c20542_g1_i1~~c20542_g1_i1.p1  ORF type:complete len:826 (-),score=303.50 c20542_g1_i1:253-2730(-)